MDNSYICKECGAPVEIASDGQKIWTCQHEGSTVIANMDAIVSADGGVAYQ